MHVQDCHQWAALIFRVMRLNQRDQTFLLHYLIRLNQESLATDLFMLASVLGISEKNCFIGQLEKLDGYI